jgi:DNA-binding NarL/FixJ family response regulator
MQALPFAGSMGEVQPRCVIVDDDDVFIDAARALLEGQGVAVVGAAGSCAEAVDRATALAPDVVLIDIRLSQESGFDAAQQLAARGPAAALIMISADRGADYADLIEQGPAIGFLAKTDISAGAIDRLLGQHRLGQR